MTYSNDLLNAIADFLASIPEDEYYMPQYISEINPHKKAALEKLLGRKISYTAFASYCTREQYEQQMGLTL